VNELFGPTLQGEGPCIGRPSWFLRLYGCNLKCRWCDTAYTWDAKRFPREQEEHEIPLGELIHGFTGRRVSHIVLTGGEPLLQRTDLYTLMSHLPWVDFDLETAGTIGPGTAKDGALRFHSVVISPKLDNSGNPLRARRHPEVIREWGATGKAWLKFVVESRVDLGEIQSILDETEFPKERVYLMPKGATREELQQTGPVVADIAKDNGFRFTPRLHIDLWGSRRGV
jgi:7-carboxy-7-deazaguanine synthase